MDLTKKFPQIKKATVAFFFNFHKIYIIASKLYIGFKCYYIISIDMLVTIKLTGTCMVMMASYVTYSFEIQTNNGLVQTYITLI